MKRKFFSNLLLLLLLNLIIKPFWVFGIDRTFQNRVGSTEYGLYFSLFSFSLVINILLDFGVTNFNNRSISQNPAKINTFFFNIVALKFFLALIYAVVVITLASVLGYDRLQIHLLFILVINQFLSSFLLFLRSNVSGLQYYTIDSILSVTDRLLMIILCSLAFWGNLLHRPVKVEDFVFMQTISYAIVIFMAGAILIRKGLRLKIRISREEIVKILRQSLPFALLFFLMSVYNRLDSVMLERMLPDGKLQTGIYAQSFRILDAFSMFAFLFSTLLLPMFSRLLGGKEPVYPLARLSSRLIFILSAAAAVGCSVYSEPVISLLYRQGTMYSALVFSILIFSFVPISLSYIFGTLLTANGNLRTLNILALMALVFNMVLNYLVIPRYKALGAAIVCLSTQSLVAAAQIILCYHEKNFGFLRPAIVRYGWFVILSLAGTLLIYGLHMHWIIKLMATFFCIGLLGFVSGILPVKHFIRVVKQQLREV